MRSFAVSADKDVGNEIITLNILCSHTSSNSFKKLVPTVNTSRMVYLCR